MKNEFELRDYLPLTGWALLTFAVALGPIYYVIREAKRINEEAEKREATGFKKVPRDFSQGEWVERITEDKNPSRGR